MHTGTFAENMSAGKGFIAIAVVVLGRWRPWGVFAAALFFGGAEALQFTLQASTRTCRTRFSWPCPMF